MISTLPSFLPAYFEQGKSNLWVPHLHRLRSSLVARSGQNSGKSHRNTSLLSQSILMSARMSSALSSLALTMRMRWSQSLISSQRLPPRVQIEVFR